MVPFSFENIARSAHIDASNAFPVSDAARSTHESFESHLQRAAATTVDQSTRGPAHEHEPPEQSDSTSKKPAPSEPIRRDVGESQRDEDDDLRNAKDAEATTVSEPQAERSDEDVEHKEESEDQVAVVAASGELHVAIQERERKASDDLDGDPDVVPAAKPNVKSVGEEEAQSDASPATKAKEPGDDEVSGSGDDAPTSKDVNRVRNESKETANTEARTPRVNPSETNEEGTAEEIPDTALSAETAASSYELPEVRGTSQRRGHRVTSSQNQPARETLDAAAKPVAVNLSETVVDIASDDSSQQRQHHRETDGPQPTGNTAPADATTSTSGTPSRFAQHLLARTEDPNVRGLSITNADQTRFIDRVARAVQATGERGGSLRLRLSPPELGSLTLEVKVQGGVVSARVEAETSAARSLLLENLPLLRERLAEHGMRVDQFDVDLTDRQADGTRDGLQQNDQQREERPRTKALSHESDEPLAISNETPTKNGSEQLNIIV